MEAETSAANAPASAADNTPKKKMIMVAIDESEESFYALNWALDHFLNNPSNIITLINVQLPFSPMVYPAGPVVFAAPTMVEAVKKAQHENATRMLSRALHLCKQKMVKVETLILDGDPKDKICQAAHELHVDLLVVGSRGLGKIKRAFLGSVSDYCAHHVHCPILIVKPSKENPKSG
ncbi:universal stress protein A-like protein [Solanum dulcamara]|uniref:universal stress protein A-like protein n=1 Tax=Solanum dulcamara TaxID=45834 RepID=UPI002485366D|nr:universal stress protein A-like protein [Solanum dulcamara]